MKVAIISIRSVKLNTTEPLLNDSDVDGGQSAASAITTTTEDTIITDPVFVQVFEAPEPDPLSDESFRVVVAQLMVETPGLLISLLTEAGGPEVSPILAYMMDKSTVDIPPPPPPPQLLPLIQVP